MEVLFAFYLAGYFLALGLYMSDWYFTPIGFFGKIFRVLILPFFSWGYVGYFIGISLNVSDAKLSALTDQLAQKTNGARQKSEHF